MYMTASNYGILFYKYPIKISKTHFCEICGDLLHSGYSHIINTLEKQNLLVEGIKHYCCACDRKIKRAKAWRKSASKLNYESRKNTY